MKKQLFILWSLLMGMMMTATAQIIDDRNFGIDGFAANPGKAGTAWYHKGGTTGGAGGDVVYANTFSELQAYLQSSKPYIILVDHDITTGIKCYIDASSTGRLCDKQDGSEGVESVYGERIMIASNKTLIGINDPMTGKAPLFEKITFVMQCAHNVIIRNCRFTMVGAPILKGSKENKIVAWRNGAQIEVGDPDCIGIQADANSAKSDSGSHIWIDHCEFFNGDADNVDRYDGLLDCKNNVQWITISYNLFRDHYKACLWGKGDSDIFDNCRTISAHHNYFKDIVGSRLPLQRGGNLHYMNNYQVNAADGWDVRTKAIGYVDACYFKDCKAPIRLRNDEGAININQDPEYSIIYDNCLRIIANQPFITYKNQLKTDEEYDWSNYKSTWLPTDTWADYYVNSHENAEDVPAICEQYSGAGKIEIWQEYASEIPEYSQKNLQAALDTPRTIGAYTYYTYDSEGNRMTKAPDPTAIESVSGSTLKPVANGKKHILNGMEITAPMKGKIYILNGKAIMAE